MEFNAILKITQFWSAHQASAFIVFIFGCFIEWSLIAFVRQISDLYIPR